MFYIQNTKYFTNNTNNVKYTMHNVSVGKITGKINQ